MDENKDIRDAIMDITLNRRRPSAAPVQAPVVSEGKVVEHSGEQESMGSLLREAIAKRDAVDEVENIELSETRKKAIEISDMGMVDSMLGRLMR